MASLATATTPVSLLRPQGRCFGAMTSWPARDIATCDGPLQSGIPHNPYARRYRKIEHSRFGPEKPAKVLP